KNCTAGKYFYGFMKPISHQESSVIAYTALQNQGYSYLMTKQPESDFTAYAAMSYPELCLAISIALLTIFPQFFEVTDPQPSLFTISYTPSSFAISSLRCSDMMPFFLLMVSLLKSLAHCEAEHYCLKTPVRTLLF